MRFRVIRTTVSLGHYWALLIIVLVIASSNTNANALNPDRNISQYGHTTWRLTEGFFRAAPVVITQTVDGYVWFGTSSGIERFDGIRFVSWNPPGTQIRDTAVSALLGASDGTLWIGSSNGSIWQWKDQRLIKYFLTGNGEISSFLDNHDGSVWATRDNLENSLGPICKVGLGHAHCYRVPTKHPLLFCHGLTRDEGGNLWFSSDTDIFKWRPSSSDIVSSRIPGGKEHHHPRIVISPDDSLWISADANDHMGVLWHFRDGRWTRFRAEGWNERSVTVAALTLDRHNALWVGTTNQGIFRIHDGKVDHFDSSEGLTADYITNFFEDREGNLWVATLKGIDCFRDLAVTTFSSRERRSSLTTDTVLASRSGNVWFGGESGIDVLKNGKISPLLAKKEVSGRQVTSLLEDHVGRFWLGVDQTMSVVTGRKREEIRRPDGRPLGFAVGIAEDGERNVWVEISGHPRELIRIKDLRVKDVLPVPQLPAARKVTVDVRGGVWLGLMNGDLARYQSGSFETFHFPHEADTYVNQIGVEADGTVLGATAYGLIGWRNGEKRVLSERSGLPCDSINAFVRDKQNSLWLATQCGLIQITSQEFQNWWEHPDIKLKIRLLDALDGAQPGLAYFQGAALSLDGRLWFANGWDLEMVDTSHMPTNSIPPPVHVETVTASEQTTTTDDSHLFPPLTRNLAIRYTALSFVAPQKVFFRYMLVGQDKDWQDAGTRRQAFYTNLGPGTYHFRVIACNNDGLWNEIGDTFSFSIAPAYYQTKWFLFLSALCSLAVAWLLYQLHLKQARFQIEQKLGARIEERERISRELHDTLFQGFQGVVLRFQGIKKILPSQGAAREMMDKVLNQADEILLEGRQAVRELRADDTNANLAEQLERCGQEFAEDSTSVLSLVVLGTPKALNPVTSVEMYRIAREALANAFRHAHAAKIEVELAYSEKHVSLIIRDDGAGIAPQILRSGKAGHWGLSGMRERARSIGAEFIIWSRPSAGTELKLSIRLNPQPPVSWAKLAWNRACGKYGKGRQWN